MKKIVRKTIKVFLKHSRKGKQSVKQRSNNI